MRRAEGIIYPWDTILRPRPEGFHIRLRRLITASDVVGDGKRGSEVREEEKDGKARSALQRDADVGPLRREIL